MPYVPPDTRKLIDQQINDLIVAIVNLTPSDKLAGTCNYAISRVIASAMKPKAGWNYGSLSDAHKTFVCAGEEFYRRMVGPYEDKAIEKNGDLTEYLNV